MLFTHSLKAVLLTSLILVATHNVFAEEDPLNQEVQNLFAVPTKITTTTAEGDTVETYVSTGSNNSVGTIKKSNGSIIQFTRTSSAGGGSSYSFTENGQVSYGSTDPSGNVISGDTATMKAAGSTDSTKTSGDLKTITSEMVPGASCRCYVNGQATGEEGVACTGSVETRKYECVTGKGLTGFQQVIAKIIRYVINIVLLLSVLAVIGLGIAWSFAGGDDVKMKSTLKTWAINIIVGLLILFMFGYILRFLAPWVYN